MQEEGEVKGSRDEVGAQAEAAALRRVRELEENAELRALKMEEAARAHADEMREKAEALMKESE
eukprot:3142249-Pyramimonas_sp.AAC.1